MNNKTKKYLDKVIEFIVVDTIIDYKQDRIIFPLSPPLSTPSHLFFPHPHYFEKYCKEIYGLTMDEIHYVWTRYKIIMFNKIKGWWFNIHDHYDTYIIKENMGRLDKLKRESMLEANKRVLGEEEYIKDKVLYLDDKNTTEDFKRLLGSK